MPVQPFRSVKVMGERATGTNFLFSLIEANFDTNLLTNLITWTPEQHRLVDALPMDRTSMSQVIERLEDHQHELSLASTGGWKHGILSDKIFDKLEMSEATLFVCILRHPALWAVSFHRRPFSTVTEPDPDLATFLATPWMTRSRDGLADAMLPSPARLWDLKTQSYLEQVARRDNVVTLLHEDLLRDHNSVLERMAELLPRKSGDWIIPEGYARAWQLPEDHPVQEQTRDRDFWSLRAALPTDPWEVIDPQATEQILRHISEKTIRNAGYTMPAEGK